MFYYCFKIKINKIFIHVFVFISTLLRQPEQMIDLLVILF